MFFFLNVRYMEFVMLHLLKFALLQFCFTFESVNFHGVIDLVVLLAASQNKICLKKRGGGDAPNTRVAGSIPTWAVLFLNKIKK